jgi:hypothetical protein
MTRPVVLRVFLIAAILCSGPVFAQQPETAPPIPHALLTAKSVFVSNAGSDSGLFPEPFSGDPARAYAEFYAQLKSAGIYTLVDDPTKADLVLELRLTAPQGPQSANKQTGASDPLPMFRLVAYQAPSHYILWTFTRSIDPAFIQKTHDSNFDSALHRLLIDLEQITGKTPTTAP